MKRITFVLSVVMALALLLSACAKPAPTEAPPAPEVPAATEAPVVTEAPAAPEEVTLVVWDQFYRDVESEVMETLNAEFEAASRG